MSFLVSCDEKNKHLNEIKSLSDISLAPIFFCMYQQNPPFKALKKVPLVSYANPFIGTGGHGHTYPGPSLLFGMIQLNPDTRLEGRDGCSGSYYSDDVIDGFSHTRHSGTGVSHYGDILLMPTNELVFNNGSDRKKGYQSKFSHQREVAEPEFYKGYLDDTHIDVELTVAKRSAMHQYTYLSDVDQLVAIDLNHRDEVIDAELQKISDYEVVGKRHSKAWATHQHLFFYIKFSHPIARKSSPEEPKNSHRIAFFVFDTPNNEPVYVQIGISSVDEKDAKENLEYEIGDRTFHEVKEEARQIWEDQLGKIVIEDCNDDLKVNFYIAMYHAMLARNLYQDLDGRYRGMDLKIHQTKKFEYHAIFPLWDTFRAVQPLYTLLEEKRTNDFIKTFLAKYDEGGKLPTWDLAANYTDCMIGYHLVSLIAESYLKGIRNDDAAKALEAMKHATTQDNSGLKLYRDFGFIPLEKASESVSKTLEYAYDDRSIAQMAKSMGKLDDYKIFLERAQYYKNVYEPSSKFMRSRFRNQWVTPFDPYEVNFNYTEANAWQYSFYVPQDNTGLIDLIGGKQQLEKQLDKLFAAQNKTSGRAQPDITGLLEQYAHGNELSHHMAYMDNFVNEPFKTQEKVGQILNEFYSNSPDGIPGNEDCGQLSAWYIFSSLGFYPVTPTSNQYIMGSPFFDKATLHSENGTVLTVQAINNSKENQYIQSVRFNGDPYEHSFIHHQDISKGGSLVFEMTHQPTSWGTDASFIPSTEIKNHELIPAPFISKGNIAFKDKTAIELESVQDDVDIYFSFGDVYKKYEKPLTVSPPLTLNVYSQKDHSTSKVISTDFYKMGPNGNIELQITRAKQYGAGGDNALIDGILGTEDFRTGTWQGYSDTDDVKMETTLFLNLGNARYVKVLADKLGKLPKWHLGASYNGSALKKPLAIR